MINYLCHLNWQKSYCYYVLMKSQWHEYKRLKYLSVLNTMNCHLLRIPLLSAFYIYVLHICLYVQLQTWKLIVLQFIRVSMSRFVVPWEKHLVTVFENAVTIYCYLKYRSYNQWNSFVLSKKDAFKSDLFYLFVLKYWFFITLHWFIIFI